MAPDLLLRRLWTKTLHERRRGIVGWGVGIGLFVLLEASFFPMVQERSEELRDLLESYPPAFKAFLGGLEDYGTGPGFLRGQLFSALLPLFFLLFAVSRGADLVAGEEERGELEILLALPLSRRRVVLEKAAALAVATSLLGLVAWALLVPLDLAYGMGVGAARLGATVLHLVLLATAFGMLALAAGCVRGRKGLAVGVAAGAAAASYLVTGLARLAPALEPALPFSLFHHYLAGDPLLHGPTAAGVLAPLVVLVLLPALGAWAFTRRDVGT